MTNRPKTKWNWGAFMFTWVFGIGNKAWLTLLTLIPILNIVWIFVCGAKGEAWAWDSGFYEGDEKAFRLSMRSWNRAGIVSFIIFLVCMLIYAGLIYFIYKTGAMPVEDIASSNTLTY